MSRCTAAFVLVLAITTCAILGAADRITPPAVPIDIQVPEGFAPFFSGHAVGTQNYFCAATPKGNKWLMVGPQATVFDPDLEQILTHYQSKNPFRDDALHATWQHSRDSSVVWAVKWKGSSDPLYVATDAIEWLLLEVTGWAAGPTGGDKLVRARYVQRVHTVGGKEPAIPCGGDRLNTRELVTYEADYYFYR